MYLPMGKFLLLTFNDVFGGNVLILDAMAEELIRLLNSGTSAAVLGQAGTGKTTLCLDVLK